MSKWILAAGAAALALTTPVLAGPGKGDNHGGGGQAHGGGPAHGGGGGSKAERGGDGGGPQRVEHGGGAERANSGHQMVRVQHGNRGVSSAQHQVAHVRHQDRQRVKAERHAARRIERQQAHAVRSAERNLRTPDTLRNERQTEDGNRFAASNFRGFSDDCPAGLAKKNNGCLPPGQARKLLGTALPASLASQMLQGPYSQWYRDNDQYYYRNDGDYIYRVDRDDGLINALFPSQDRDYSYYPVGMTYPADYNSYNVPYQYQSFYPDGNDYNYRYGDGAIYQVNRSNNGIESIVALLAGDLGVGQTMPSDYGVYNVPMAYRDRYYDTPDAMYRYNDGYIYQADPKTQLITAVIDALV